MNEELFWSMIEDAWKTVKGKRELRHKLSFGKEEEGDVDELLEDLDEVIPSLRDALWELGQEDLLKFDRLLERKLFELDRAEIQEQTDGSDDGFLYSRGFIVAMGREYYEAVHEDPTLAVMDAEGEEMCYLSSQLYEERFGEMPASGISRESHSNKLGWPGKV